MNKIEATHDNSSLMLHIETDQNINPGDTMMIAFDHTWEYRRIKTPEWKNTEQQVGIYAFHLYSGQDTAVHPVTQAYDMNGLTPRFNLSDPLVAEV